MSRPLSLTIIGSLFVIYIFSIFKPAQATWLIDRSGTLIEETGYVLGDEKKLEQATEARIKSQELRRETVQSQLENKGGNIRVRQEVQNEAGELIREGQTDLPPRERLRIENANGQMVEVGTVEDRLEITNNNIKARTDHPITIGDNNELIITRPDGTEKVVTILPDVAADKLRERGLITTGSEAELELQDNLPVYKFRTMQVKKLFGLFPRELAEESVVSAESGELVSTSSTQTSPFRRLLDRLSF